GSDSESIESVKLLKANGSLNLNGVLNTHNYQELTSGSNYSGLTLDIESVKKDPDAPPKSTTYVNKIHFKKSAGVKKDYDYKSILGSALKYGITADRFEQDNHAQTNLAVNFYEYNGFVITSDLSAPTAGDFYIPWYVHYDDSTDPPKADKSMALTPEQDGLIFFENKSVQGMVLHADGPERLKDMNSRLDYVDVKTDMTSEQMSETVIEPAIAHMKTVSADLLTHPQNVTPDFAGVKVSVNCKSLDKDATIYLDGDAIVKAMGGNLKYDNFTIEKKENQTIILNFKDTESLKLEMPKVKIVNDDGFGPVKDSSENYSKADTSKDSPTNQWLDRLTRHVVFNLSSVKNLDIESSAGIFLLPQEDSKCTISGTSTGWLVSDGYVTNPSAEWHFVYSDMDDVPEENTASPVKISKTDIAGTKQLEGAVLTITPDAGTVLDISKIKVAQDDNTEPADLKVTADKVQFRTGGQKVNITGLPDGKYTLTEETAPNGYLKAESISFEIRDGKVYDQANTAFADNTVIMRDAPDSVKYDMDFSKRDMTGAEIGGAHIRVFENGSATNIDEWDSVAGQSHTIRGTFEAGKTYVMEETSAPAGFKIADRIYFQVDKDGKLFTSSKPDSFENQAKEAKVVMIDEASVVKISKIDAASKEQLEGAKLEITPAAGTALDVKNIKVTDSKGDYTAEITPDKISFVTGKDIVNVTGLPNGKYTLTEITAPDGYEKAESISFTIENGKVVGGDTVTMEDKPTEASVVKISKIDASTKEQLEGAKLQITPQGDTKIDV
ncbi:MAG: hypothetical protein IJ906_04105, partial [Oscillospiraceae bacterium]|nr:hypothetical protein [Oscillospiraceae bacterium]